jgi:hypothetical protein
MSGKAIRHCVMISGGVKTAARINIISTAYLLFLDKTPGVTIPTFERKSIARGSWKAIPNAILRIAINDTYLSTVIIGIRSWVAKLNKNLMAIGTIRKYPKRLPRIKRMKEKNPNRAAYLFSFFSSPAEINAHIWKTTKGEDKNTPPKSASFILVINASAGEIKTSLPTGLTR